MTRPAAAPGGGARLIVADELASRDRYHLLTSLVVPRPIGWVSSRSAAGVLNLAPFSYFSALSATPFLIGISIGSRKGSPKDTLTNIRDAGAFCVNVVTDKHLSAMNESSGEHGPDVDEFAVAGVEPAEGELVRAPYVAGCPAVFECELHREVELGDSHNVLVIGAVRGVRVGPELRFAPGTHMVDPDSLQPVARLGGELYAMLGEIRALPRPVIL